MSVQLILNCDKCGSDIEDHEDIHCGGCVDEIREEFTTEIRRLYHFIEKLESDIKKQAKK